MNAIYWREYCDPDQTGERKGKFVIIEAPEHKTYMVCATYKTAEYHAEIVARFLKEQGIYAFILVPTGESCQVYEKGWSVAGGGHYCFHREAKTLELKGNSIAYGGVDFNRLVTMLTLPEISILVSNSGNRR